MSNESKCTRRKQSYCADECVGKDTKCAPAGDDTGVKKYLCNRTAPTQCSSDQKIKHRTKQSLDQAEYQIKETIQLPKDVCPKSKLTTKESHDGTICTNPANYQPGDKKCKQKMNIVSNGYKCKSELKTTQADNPFCDEDIKHEICFQPEESMIHRSPGAGDVKRKKRTTSAQTSIKSNSSKHRRSCEKVGQHSTQSSKPTSKPTAQHTRSKELNCCEFHQPSYSFGGNRYR